MNTTAAISHVSLSGAHLRTYEKIFRHPVSHSLVWRDIRDLLANLGSVVIAPNGNQLIVRHGHTFTLQNALMNSLVGPESIMKLRHFLTDSEEPTVDAGNDDGHFLVVINRLEAHVFRSEMRDTLPEGIVPADVPGSNRTANFIVVAQALASASQILILGTGFGVSPEMVQFQTWLRQQHPELHRKVIGARVIDERQLAEPQLLAAARYFYATR